MKSFVGVLGLLLVVAGCGAGVPSSPPPEKPYDGPMVLPQDFADDATAVERSGAAGRALECTGTPYAGGGGDYDGGLEEVQDSAPDAIENFITEEGAGTGVPDNGYQLERQEKARSLYSFDVDRRTVIAFIVSDRVTDYRDETGWGVESWAQCDPAELPAELTEDSYLQVWTDVSGQRVPASVISSYQGAEHCDWQDITFLQLGEDPRQPGYVRDPSGELDNLLTGVLDRDATVPKDARDTGYRRDGRQLWLTDDAAYLVKVGQADDVEKWPRAKDPIGCA